MQGHVVAVYKSRGEAEQAYSEIVSAGVPAERVRLNSKDRAHTTADGGSIWDWLFGSGMPEDDRRSYDERMAGGGAVLSVLVDSPSVARLDEIEIILDKYHPLEMNDADARAAAAPGGSGTMSRSNAGAIGAAAPTSSRAAQGEQVIPLPEEELKVGKRATERVQRIRTYVVEEPVQKDVRLRDERTVVERRPATGSPQAMPGEREVEVREVHEEPIAQKTVKAGEELVVRKEATERTERVSDTVKKTKADVNTQKR
ncbi:YsnF/AvaK domain-containing protein [Bradyrhizobium sp. PMVTL-01]|uniref:YsnF/AvaK domain-containing protein n=1 Tax=Bradyrhizobium sp. PMVTL-01 TaxID=3434999 RepID=UPI003F71F954